MFALARRIGPACALALAAAPAFAAEPGLLGARFAPATCPDCEQAAPAVAGSRSGAFLVLWEGSSASDRQGAFARAFTRAGRPRPGAFPLSGDALPAQSEVATVTDTAGNFIAAWTSVAQGRHSIQGQRLRINGSPLGAPFTISAAPDEPRVDHVPVLAATPRGGFLAAWVSFPAPAAASPDTPVVRVRGFDAANQPLGPEKVVSSGLVADRRPAVCADAAGKAVVAWVTADELRPFQPHREGVSFQRLSAAGALAGAATVVAPPVAARAETALACRRGVVVVAWRSDQAAGGDADDILARRYSRRGRPLGAPVLLNTETSGLQRSPALAADDDGAWVAAWDSFAADEHRVVVRRFRAGGAADGGEVTVAAIETHPSSRPALAFAGAGGGLVVVWQEKAEVFGQRLGFPR